MKKIIIIIIAAVALCSGLIILIANILSKQIHTDNSCEARQANISTYIRPVKAECRPVETGGRWFGAPRANNTRSHSGIDFMPVENGHGTPVYAAASGMVTSYYHFYDGTDALVVRNDDGTIIRYGEIRSDLRAGERITQGQHIATIAALSSGNAMLHLEWYCGCESGKLTQSNNADNLDNFIHVTTTGHGRRADLLDPTAFFDLPLYPLPVPYEPRTKLKSINNNEWRVEVRNYDFTTSCGKLVPIYYTFPAKRPNAKTQVLFAVHGTGRNVTGMINTWRYLSQTENIIVICPELSGEEFSGSEFHQMGLVGNLDNPEKWTARIIDEIFLDFTERFKLTKHQSGGYILYGHSAGAQFAHRSLIFSQSEYLRYAIPANAGVYTFLTDIARIPFGFSDVPYDHPVRELMHENLGRKLYILIGDRDNDPHAEDLPTSSNAMKQGEHRYERALNFYETSRDYAYKNNLDFNWELIIMPGVGHNSGSTRGFVIDIVTGIYDGTAAPPRNNFTIIFIIFLTIVLLISAAFCGYIMHRKFKIIYADKRAEKAMNKNIKKQELQIEQELLQLKREMTKE